MRTRVALLLAGLAALSLAVGAQGSSSSKTKYSSTLGIRAEIPKPKGASPNAGGQFAMTLTRSGSKYSITWSLTFYRLTGKALAAHIHVGPPSGTGPVVVPLCGPCTSGQTGKASVPASLFAALTAQTAYVNVHTAKNPDGEIRGRIYKAA
jgi:hypothetical protein